MVFGKILAATGVDGARVDAQLDADTVDVGGTITGRLVVDGGGAEQEVRGLEAVLVVDAMKTDDRATLPTVLTRADFDEGFTLAAGERREIPFELAVPAGAPPAMTERPAHVYVTSAADVPLAVDPTDVDPVTVRPTQLHRDVLTVMTEHGLHLEQEHVMRTRRGVMQELAFEADAGGEQAVEVAFVPAPGDGYDLIVDENLAGRTAKRLVADALDVDIDESEARMHMPGGPDGPGLDRVRRALAERVSGT
ncbi:sporulation-control protein [Limimonas halophila]|uniref:Sporulation-control protein n=1 Tax=Limimonas halophila TaxID=1082479 RepID=A0A1G7PNW7_9PROT|nr:sporulation protein [Limimonas halophila]SDF87918.1 sporulation-control protein [Limimonas halophila]